MVDFWGPQAFSCTCSLSSTMPMPCIKSWKPHRNMPPLACTVTPPNSPTENWRAYETSCWFMIIHVDLSNLISTEPATPGTSQYQWILHSSINHGWSSFSTLKVAIIWGHPLSLNTFPHYWLYPKLLVVCTMYTYVCIYIYIHMYIS